MSAMTVRDRKPRRSGVPPYLWHVIFGDGSDDYYWPESGLVESLFRDMDVRDDYEIRIVGLCREDA